MSQFATKCAFAKVSTGPKKKVDIKNEKKKKTELETKTWKPIFLVK